MKIGEKIKIARTLKGLTQKELGVLVGLSDVRIRQYELNLRTPKDGVLQKIAESTGFSTEYFTDHSTDTYNDVLHILFELNKLYGLSIQKSGFKSGKQQYTMEIADAMLNNLVSDWLESVERIKTQKIEDGNVTAEQRERECLIWEGRYPLSAADDSEARLRNSHKKIREKQQNDL